MQLLDSHSMERLHQLYMAGQDADTADMQSCLNALDNEVSDYMRHAEQQCWAIKNGTNSYLPEAELWICCHQVYTKLLHCLHVNQGNRSNLLLAAWRCGIEHPFHLSQQELHHHLEICTENCKYFWLHGPQHCSSHLTNQLQAAQEKEDSDAMQRIQEIIAQEWQRHWFTVLRRLVGKVVCCNILKFNDTNTDTDMSWHVHIFNTDISKFFMLLNY